MASFDYGIGSPDQEALKRRSYSDWLLDFMRVEIDCVVIADHNSGGGIDAARAALPEFNLKCAPDKSSLGTPRRSRVVTHKDPHPGEQE